jgi:hypothetical protein
VISKKPVAKRSKYGNVKTEYSGYKYDSKAEALYAQHLDLRIRAGEVEKWDRQVVVHLDIGKVKICKYIADFVVTLKDGSVEWIDVKGVKTSVFQIKHKLLKALRPDIKLILIEKKKPAKKNIKKK